VLTLQSSFDSRKMAQHPRDFGNAQITAAMAVLLTGHKPNKADMRHDDDDDDGGRWSVLILGTAADGCKPDASTNSLMAGPCMCLSLAEQTGVRLHVRPKVRSALGRLSADLMAGLNRVASWQRVSVSAGKKRRITKPFATGRQREGNRSLKQIRLS
jgi:hypothetical protein